MLVPSRSGGITLRQIISVLGIATFLGCLSVYGIYEPKTKISANISRDPNTSQTPIARSVELPRVRTIQRQREVAVNASRTVGQSGPGREPLVFDTTSVDLGNVHEGETIDIEFGFINASNTPVRILSITPGCSCTIVSTPPETISPQGREIITTSLRTHGKSGRVSKPINVKYQYKKAILTRTLTLNGIVRPRSLMVTMPRTVNIGEHSTGVDWQASIQLSQHEHSIEDALIESIHCPPEIDYLLEEIRGERRQWRLTLSGKTPDVVGPINRQLVVRTSCEKQSKITIPVLGTIRGALSAEPGRLIKVVSDQTEADTSVVIADENRRSVRDMQVHLEELSGGRVKWARQREQADAAGGVLSVAFSPDFDPDQRLIKGVAVVSLEFDEDNAGIRIPFMFLRSAEPTDRPVATR